MSARTGAGRPGRPGAPNDLQEFLEAVRLRGVRWAARSLSRRFLFSYRQAFLFRGPLLPLDATAEDAPPFEYRLATAGDLDRLAVFEPYVVRRRMRRWLESDGTWVFLALDGDRPVAFECTSTAPFPDPVLPPMTLAKDQVWMGEVYVVPEYRRRHVSRGLRQYRHRTLRGWGFVETLSKVDADNYVSLKHSLSILRLSSSVRRVSCLCLFGLRWWWTDEDARPLLEAHVLRQDRRRSRSGAGTTAGRQRVG
jgi:hypothetical protein